MANLKQRIAIFIAGSITVFSGPGCSSSPNNSDDGDLGRDEVPAVSVEPNSSNRTAIAVACGDFATLGSDSPSIDDEGHIVVSEADVTVSISADGDRRLTTSDNGLTFGENTGLPFHPMSMYGHWGIPGGQSQVHFVKGIRDENDLPEDVRPDITIESSGTTLSASATSRGVNAPLAKVFAYRPDVDDIYADVVTFLDTGIAHVGFEGSLADRPSNGDPFLSAESLNAADLPDDPAGSVYTKELRSLSSNGEDLVRGRPGDVIGVSVSNTPDMSDPDAPMLSCVSLAVVTENFER